MDELLTNFPDRKVAALLRLTIFPDRPAITVRRQTNWTANSPVCCRNRQRPATESDADNIWHLEPNNPHGLLNAALSDILAAEPLVDRLSPHD